MQFEDFDNKLREAADQHHPNYDEKAWSQMEKLLDKHLPQKKDRRRRIIFFLLFIFLLGGGTWLLFDKPWGNDLAFSENKKIRTGHSDDQQIGDGKKDEPTSGTPRASNDSQDMKPDPGGMEQGADAGVVSNSTSPEPALPSTKETFTSQVEVTPAVPVGKQKRPRAKSNSNDRQLDIITDNAGIGKRENDQVSTTANDNPSGFSSGNTTGGATAVISATAVPTDPAVDGSANVGNRSVSEKISNSVAEETIPEKDSATTVATIEVRKVNSKSQAKKPGAFFISLGAGPDVSSVGFKNPGKVKLLTGVGIGYTLKDRWTIRTGFYTASKVYTATPEQYKPTTAPNNPSFLESISADCKVYEIPLTVSYHFGNNPRERFFASAGLSSFLMKKETYDYLYVYPAVPNPVTYHYVHSSVNENKHYFAVLSLSAGFERKINRVLSFAAEPYLKIPMAGVGYGKVKLNSFGILMSLNIHPFNKAVK